MDLQLDRMQAALKAMGSPCESIPAIQVAGTNGKGSIACFLASALQKAGIRTGLTISPHLVSWCERIRVDGQQISPTSLRQRLITLQEISRLHRLTPFEQLLATSFAHFRRTGGADGAGGRAGWPSGCHNGPSPAPSDRHGGDRAGSL